MRLEDVLNKAFAEGDRNSLTQAANLMRMDVLRALQTGDWNELLALEQQINDALVPYRGIIRSEEPNESYIVGQFYALQGIARAYREGHASPDDIAAAKRSKIGLKLLKELYRNPFLMARQLMDALGVDDSHLSQIGANLQREGLLRKDRIGRQVSYRLTAAGNLAARDIAAQEATSARDVGKEPAWFGIRRQAWERNALKNYPNQPAQPEARCAGEHYTETIYRQYAGSSVQKDLKPSGEGPWSSVKNNRAASGVGKGAEKYATR